MGEIVRQTVPKMAVNDLVLESAARANILPVISTCNVRCKFCSHEQNPPGAEALKMPAISMDLAEKALSLMDPGKPVVIGESVTRLMEGEPFVHPRIRDILALIRKRLPGSEIRLTTNGNMLGRDMVEFLASLGGVVICLSLNSSDISVRRYLMNDARAGIAVSSAALLGKAGVPCHGSIVAMPHLAGWQDLADTIKFFDRHGAVTVRVFLPGCTFLAPRELKVPPGLRGQLGAFINGIRHRVKVPVTLEPPLIRDLSAEVSGVIAGSPAFRAGIRAGDIILSVDGIAVRSRVDAFRRILSGRNTLVEVSRREEIHSFNIVKKKGGTSGLVLDYDIDPSTVMEIERAVRRRRARRAVLLTSEMGYPAVKMGLDNLSGEGHDIRPVAVKNRFFGGSIGCAGLLTVADMLEDLRMHRDGADLAIVPEIAFDARGRDVTGRSCLDLGPEIEII